MFNNKKLYHSIQYYGESGCVDVVPHPGDNFVELIEGDSVLITTLTSAITERKNYSFEISDVKEIKDEFAVLENDMEIRVKSHRDIGKYTVFGTRHPDFINTYRIASKIFTENKSFK